MANTASVSADFQTILDHLPDAISRWSRDGRLLYANTAFLRITGQELSDIRGASFSGLHWPEAVAEVYQNHLQLSFSTQKKAFFSYHYISESGTMIWQDAQTIPEADEKQQIVSILIVAREMSSMRRQEKRFRSLIDNAPVATCVFAGPELVIEVANDIMLSYWGKDRSVIGMPLHLAVPELQGQAFIDILKEVYATGKTYQSIHTAAELPLGGIPGTYYFDFTYKALIDDAGKPYAIMEMAVDVTEEVLAQQQFQVEKQRADLAVELARLGVYEVDLSTDKAVTNDRFSQIMGVSPGGTRSEYDAYFHPDDVAVRDRAYEELRSKGYFDYQARLLAPGQPQKWIRSTAKLLPESGGQPAKLMGLILDVTQQKDFEELLALEVTNRTNELRTAQSSLELSNAYLQIVLDNFETAFASLMPIFRGKQIIDFRFKKTNAAYSAYSQLSPSAIENRPASEIFPEYFQTEAFEKYVESYLTGKDNAWALHYNVDGLDVHLRVLARKMGEEVIVQFTDFTKLKNLEGDLLRKIDELERSNRNLEEFAYAASHDLKEPIRKIIIFTDMLYKSLEGKLNEREAHHFKRMELASQRMFSLVEDLLSFSQVNRRPLVREDLELQDILNLVLGDLELEIQQHRATIHADHLCRVSGYNRQLQQAFHNIVGNAIKYASPDRPPVISINCRSVSGRDISLVLNAAEQQLNYAEVSIQDNGIGFNEADADRMFDVFTRLHGSQYAQGTGVGLAIVRKVMENHDGFIRATSAEKQGSTFFLYFPEIAAGDPA